MSTPFDATLAGVFWSGRSVGERTIDQLIANVKTMAPTMTALYVKTSDGAHWQGRFDSTNPGLTMSGPDALGGWIGAAGQAGISIHAWCVLKGEDVGGEAQRVLEACAVPGLRSMLLDVEDGPAYFVGGADNARRLAQSIRRSLPDDFHLGLIFDPRGQHPKHISIEEWLPHVQSLHPMIYHGVFGVDPRSALQEGMAVAQTFGKPVVPMLQAFDGVPPDEMVQAGRMAFGLGARGISYFRLGTIGPREFAALRQVERPAVIVADGRPLHTDPEPEAGGAVIVRPGQPGYSDGAYQDLPPDQDWQEMVDIHGWTVRYKRSAPRQMVYASYRPELPGPGTYVVEVFVPSARADTQAATYFISYYHGAERLERKVSLNQSQYYNQWAALGYFAFDPAQPDSGRVNLVDYSIEDPPRWIAFSAVRWRPAEPVMQTPPEPEPVRLGDGFDAPVGTAEERAGGKLWPGFWKDAWHPRTGYARQYKDSAGNIAYHTGADLNLNEPRFNLDRGAPVYATAAGEVVFAGRVGNFWRNIIIIRHDPLPDGRQYYSRYAHVENIRVNVGDRIQRGQQISVVGSSGGPNGNYHLHFDISPTDVLAEHPGHWPGTNLRGVLTHYVDPIEFIGKHRPSQG